MMKIHSIACVALLGALVGYGCSSSDGVNGDGDGSGDGDGAGASGNGDGDGSGNGDGDGSSSDGSAGASGNGDGDGSGNGDGSGTSAGWTESDIPYTYDPTLDEDPDTCASDSIQAEEIPLDVVIILDRSGSMRWLEERQQNVPGSRDCEVGNNIDARWCNAIDAIYDFAAQPSSVGMGLGFDTFGGSNQCTPGGLALDIAPLQAGDANMQLAKLRTELNDATPTGGTPTVEAIDTIAAVTSARKEALAMAGEVRKVIGIIVTDGEPDSTCSINGVPNTDNPTWLNERAKEHFVEELIPIFYIGMTGLDTGLLQTLAEGTGAEPHDTCLGGGTDCADDHDRLCGKGGPDTCSYYSVGTGSAAAFNTALDAIRETVSGCDFAIPSDSGLVDLSGVEVTFTPGGGATETLNSLDNEEDCEANEGYFVEGTGNDATIKLCPSTCERNDTNSTVDIVIPCQGQ